LKNEDAVLRILPNTVALNGELEAPL